MKFRPKYRQRETVFESFSDMVLCVVIVLVTLIIVLALNVQQQFLSFNRFTGGAVRPTLFLQAGAADFSKTDSAALQGLRQTYGSSPSVMMHLFSPSMGTASTKVDGSKVVSRYQNETFSGQYDMTAYEFLKLAAGIDPGSFGVDGQQTALMLPKFAAKVLVYEPGRERGLRETADRPLALALMQQAWPVYSKPLYPIRSAGEYRDARTQIYVETMSQGNDHYIYIGQKAFKVPDAVEDGSLHWLEGLSSGLTEIVYLGEAWLDADKQTNKRIQFFEENGFADAADAYRKAVFGKDLSDADIQKKISRELLAGRPVDSAILPPLLTYRDAWQAYIEKSLSSDAPSRIPDWFDSEFLTPLGFDRRIILGQGE